MVGVSRAVPDRRRSPRQPLHEEIQDHLVEMGLHSGDPIPSEAQLIEILGVSRGTLREALKQLQALGIIETRHGTGMFIAPFSLSPFVNGLLFHGKIADDVDAVRQAANLAEVRELLERQLIRRVAEEIDEAGLEHLRERLAAMSAGPENSRELDEADLAFHTALYQDLGNSLVLDLVVGFWHVLRLLRPRLSDHFDQRATFVAKHDEIVRALEQHDPDAAEAAMGRHFEGTRAWLQAAHD